jgi:hypothetical protein
MLFYSETNLSTASEKIPIWLTFAVTVFLDIHHTLRTRKDVEPLERPFNELQHIGEEASRTFEKHLEFSGQIEAPSTSQEGKEEYEKRKALEADHLQDLKREIDCFILDDILYYFKMKYYQEVEKVFPGESERFSLYHRHPVLWHSRLPDHLEIAACGCRRMQRMGRSH